MQSPSWALSLGARPGMRSLVSQRVRSVRPTRFSPACCEDGGDTGAKADVSHKAPQTTPWISIRRRENARCRAHTIEIKVVRWTMQELGRGVCADRSTFVALRLSIRLQNNSLDSVYALSGGKCSQSVIDQQARFAHEASLD